MPQMGTCFEDDDGNSLGRQLIREGATSGA